MTVSKNRSGRGEDPALSVLLDKLYERSENLPRSDWYTTTLQEFERLLRASQPTELGSFRASLRKRLKASWDRYERIRVTPPEQTAETVAGHRLLVEGLAGWQEALELSESGAEVETVLEAAEDANRLLVVVQLHARSVRREAL